MKEKIYFIKGTFIPISLINIIDDKNSLNFFIKNKDFHKVEQDK